jgi:hypothetical protein
MRLDRPAAGGIDLHAFHSNALHSVGLSFLMK